LSFLDPVAYFTSLLTFVSRSLFFVIPLRWMTMSGREYSPFLFGFSRFLNILDLFPMTQP